MLRSVASRNSSMKAVGEMSAKPNREKRAPQAPREAEAVVPPPAPTVATGVTESAMESGCQDQLHTFASFLLGETPPS
jgi:hypothetical protein